MIKISNFENFTYLFLILGFFVDHISTTIGINYYNLYETNFIVRELLKYGLWGAVDLLICLLLILSIKLFVVKFQSFKFIIIVPFFAGILRLMVGFSNIILIL